MLSKLVVVFLACLYGAIQGQEVDYNPTPAGDYVFYETFQVDGYSRWTKSKHSKYGTQKWLVEEATAGIEGDKGLVIGEKAKHYGIYTTFESPVVNTGKDLVIQYEVALTKGLECGGAYLKFLDAEATADPKMELTNETPYIVMFGPDKCGTTNKVHLIIRHKNPISGVWEEKHLKHPPSVPIDEQTHLYTLTIRNDNTFDVKVDEVVKREGSLLAEFDPPFSPPKEIDDPEDHKPEDWVDTKKIPDASATKPDDWDEDAPYEIVDLDAKKPAGWLDDEEEFIKDPEAVIPDDWDTEEDGDWEAPLIKNPKCDTGCGTWERPTKKNPAYKGKWSAPLIDNPAYIGEWSAKKIPNPHYFVEETPCNLPAIGGVAIEIWTMTEGIVFDNIFIGYDPAAAAEFAAATWKAKNKLEVGAAEAKKAELELQRREALKESGTLTAKVEYYAYLVLDFFKANPIALIPPVLILVAILYFLTKSFSSGVPVKDGEDEDVDVTAAEGEEEEEEGEGTEEKTADADATESSDKVNEGLRKRKNIPKAE